jgi:signal transduction histidine kinase
MDDGITPAPTPTSLRRAPGVDPQAPRPPRAIRAALTIPLTWKLLGANAVILATAAVVVWLAPARVTWSALGLAAAAFVASALVNVALVRLALRPLHELERTARRVWEGDLGARAEPSALADRDMARLLSTFNLLLDGLSDERTRTRRLAAHVVNGADDDRARVARTLHDSAAQTLAALSLHARAAVAGDAAPALAAHLEAIRDLAVQATEEVRDLSHTVHPRVLDDLGLPAALESLARSVGDEHGVDVNVHARLDPALVPRRAAMALYAVAREALANAVRHARPGGVEIVLGAGDGRVRLEVTDDGSEFDLREARGRSDAAGLFAMRERLALVDGELEVTSAPGRGTRIVATAPLATPMS